MSSTTKLPTNRIPPCQTQKVHAVQSEENMSWWHPLTGSIHFVMLLKGSKPLENPIKINQKYPKCIKMKYNNAKNLHNIKAYVKGSPPSGIKDIVFFRHKNISSKNVATPRGYAF